MEDLHLGSGSKVYYIPFRNSYDHTKLVFSFHHLLNHYHFRLLTFFDNEDVIGIKVNVEDCLFNQDSYQVSVAIKLLKTLVQLLNGRDVHSFICDTSSRYRDRKQNGVTLMKKASGKGLSSETIGTSFLPLDGIAGTQELIREIVLPNQGKQNIYLAGELLGMAGLICFNGVEPHFFTGLTGALKTLGSDLASKRGKTLLYSKSKPRVNESRCFYCRKCVHRCPVGAIIVNEENRHVEINSDLCIDCGACVEIAKYGGIVYDWDADKDYFQGKLFKNIQAILQLLSSKMLYINLVPSRTFSQKETLLEGILISRDPVAIDKACADLFPHMVHPKVDMANFLSQAQAQGLGTLKYQLVDVSY